MSEWVSANPLVFRAAEAELAVVVTKEENARSENQFSTWLSLWTRVSELSLWVDAKVSHNLHQEEIVEKNSGDVARSMMIFWEILSGITDMVYL